MTHVWTEYALLCCTNKGRAVVARVEARPATVIELEPARDYETDFRGAGPSWYGIRCRHCGKVPHHEATRFGHGDPPEERKPANQLHDA